MTNHPFTIGQYVWIRAEITGGRQDPTTYVTTGFTRAVPMPWRCCIRPIDKPKWQPFMVPVEFLTGDDPAMRNVLRFENYTRV